MLALVPDCHISVLLWIIINKTFVEILREEDVKVFLSFLFDIISLKNKKTKSV